MSSNFFGVRGTQRPATRISRKKLRAEIALAGVRQNCEQRFTAAKLLGDKAACVKYRSRGNPAKNSLLLRGTPRRSARVVIRNRDESVDDFWVEDIGNETGPNALNLVRPRLAAGENRRFCGFYRENFQRSDFFLEHFT